MLAALCLGAPAAGGGGPSAAKLQNLPMLQPLFPSPCATCRKAPLNGSVNGACSHSLSSLNVAKFQRCFSGGFVVWAACTLLPVVLGRYGIAMSG